MSNPNPETGLTCTVSEDGMSVTAVLKDETGHSVTMDCDSERLRQMAIILLTAGYVAAERSGRKAPDYAPRDISDRPLPVSRVGLLPGPKGQSDVLTLVIGEIQLGFRLHIDTLRELGNAMIAASAHGAPH